MSITVRKYTEADLPRMKEIWNEVVFAADAFPQQEPLAEDAADFFAGQSYCGVAEENGEVLGLYILHPNNVGRCGHICNASYAVKSGCRGKHIGEALVKDCLKQGRELGFRILQFNAVVESNTPAIRLYEKLGFIRLGTVPGGFRTDTGYENIVLFYHEL